MPVADSHQGVEDKRWGVQARLRRAFVIWGGDEF